MNIGDKTKHNADDLWFQNHTPVAQQPGPPHWYIAHRTRYERRFLHARTGKSWDWVEIGLTYNASVHNTCFHL